MEHHGWTRVMCLLAGWPGSTIPLDHSEQAVTTKRRKRLPTTWWSKINCGLCVACVFVGWLVGSLVGGWWLVGWWWWWVNALADRAPPFIHPTNQPTNQPTTKTNQPTTKTNQPTNQPTTNTANSNSNCYRYDVMIYFDDVIVTASTSCAKSCSTMLHRACGHRRRWRQANRHGFPPVTFGGVVSFFLLAATCLVGCKLFFENSCIDCTSKSDFVINSVVAGCFATCPRSRRPHPRRFDSEGPLLSPLSTVGRSRPPAAFSVVASPTTGRVTLSFRCITSVEFVCSHSVEGWCAPSLPAHQTVTMEAASRH